MEPQSAPGEVSSRRPRARGSVLVLVLVLMVIVLAASVFAVWSLRSDTGAAGRDRLGRQLFDCADQGLQWGKQYFSTGNGRSNWNLYLTATVCGQANSYLPCPPFPANAPGPAQAGYPDQPPFTTAITVGGVPLVYQVGIYNNPEVPASPFADNDSTIVVYSICREPTTGQSRSVQAVINATIPVNNDYLGQAGGGFRNQGNRNR